jgi:hypothetical protein
VRSSRFRGVARLFAIVLLAWTAADVCGHGICEHDREPIAPAAPTGSAGPSSVNRLPVGAPADAPLPTGPDDCFCCSRFVDVQVPFLPSLVYAVAWTVPDPIAPMPVADPSRLYHPPLA